MLRAARCAPTDPLRILLQQGGVNAGAVSDSTFGLAVRHVRPPLRAAKSVLTEWKLK